MQRYAPIANGGEIHVETHNSFDSMQHEHIKAFCKNAILVRRKIQSESYYGLLSVEITFLYAFNN
jgi:hypothetical protein